MTLNECNGREILLTIWVCPWARTGFCTACHLVFKTQLGMSSKKTKHCNIMLNTMMTWRHNLTLITHIHFTIVFITRYYKIQTLYPQTCLVNSGKYLPLISTKNLRLRRGYSGLFPLHPTQHNKYIISNYLCKHSLLATYALRLPRRYYTTYR